MTEKKEKSQPITDNSVSTAKNSLHSKASHQPEYKIKELECQFYSPFMTRRRYGFLGN